MTRLWHSGTRTRTCDHECHLQRGSAGGEDYAMPVGTPLYAPRDGRIRWRNGGTGGWTLTLAGVDGVEYEAMHCSGNALGLLLGGGGVDVREGQHVGYSGGAVGHPGAGSSTGPHCHEHYWTAASGRRPLSEIVTSAPAGGDTSPFPEDQEVDMLNMEIVPITNVPGDQSKDSWEAVGVFGRRPLSDSERITLQAVENNLKLGWKEAPNSGGDAINLWLQISREVNSPPAPGGVPSIDYEKLATAIAGKVTVPPLELTDKDRQDIAAEVIRQQKLPGKR